MLVRYVILLRAIETSSSRRYGLLRGQCFTVFPKNFKILRAVIISKMSRPVLSTHVLDTAVGSPAVGVFIELFKQHDEGSWTQWHSAVTSSDGRALFPFSKESMAPGTYKLKFDVGTYYKTLGKKTIYDYVEIVFTTEEDQHYHMPLLLSPYGYTTYRGS